MKTRIAIVCTCTFVIIFLVMESRCAPKNKLNSRNWGPQSMLYLKGKYGRRYASDYDEDQYHGLSLNDLNIKGYQKLRSVEFRNIRRMLTADNLEILP